MLYVYYIVIRIGDRDLELVISTNPSTVRFDQSNRRLQDPIVNLRNHSCKEKANRARTWQYRSIKAMFSGRKLRY